MSCNHLVTVTMTSNWKRMSCLNHRSDSEDINRVSKLTILCSFCIVVPTKKEASPKILHSPKLKNLILPSPLSPKFRWTDTTTKKESSPEFCPVQVIQQMIVSICIIFQTNFSGVVGLKYKNLMIWEPPSASKWWCLHATPQSHK